MSVTASAPEPLPTVPRASALRAPLDCSVTSSCCKYSHSTLASVDFLAFLGLSELASILAAVAVLGDGLLAGLADGEEEKSCTLPAPALPSLSQPLISTAKPEYPLLSARSQPAASAGPSASCTASWASSVPPVVSLAGAPAGARSAEGAPRLTEALAHMSTGSCTVCWVYTCNFLKPRAISRKMTAPPNLILWSSLQAVLMPVPFIGAFVAI